MSRQIRSILLAAGALAALYTSCFLMAGGLILTAHEADMIHLSDMVLRMADGQVPHRDFMTPIGGWAVQPMALLFQAGLGLGSAMIWGQVLVALALLTIAAWVGASRLTSGQSLGLLIAVAGLGFGLVFGGDQPLLSLSMHYNRWCWAAATLVVVMTFVTPDGDRCAARDGALIGGLMAAMAMVKVTYALALALPILLALLHARRSRALWTALATALFVLLVVTLFEGLAYWRAYADDLLAVTRSSHRAMPSAGWRALVFSPSGLPLTALMLAAWWALRRAGLRQAALALVVFYPAFVFISWQNYGNDPLWLVAVALVLWSLSGRVADPLARKVTLAAALAAGVMILPVGINILTSPMHHAILPQDLTRPMLPDHGDLRMATARGQGAWISRALIPSGQGEPTVFQGQTLPDCTLTGGLIAVLERDGAALMRLDPALDRQPLVADLLSPHWMFEGLRPLRGAAPWYYDGLPGLADATHLMVPDCPADPSARRHFLGLIESQDLRLAPAGQAEGFTLYRIER